MAEVPAAEEARAKVEQAQRLLAFGRTREAAALARAAQKLVPDQVDAGDILRQIDLLEKKEPPLSAAEYESSAAISNSGLGAESVDDEIQDFEEGEFPDTISGQFRAFTSAHNKGDHGHVLEIAELILPAMPDDAKVIKATATDSARQLIRECDPTAIDRALSYCEHWLHLTNAREAHQLRAALVQRVERVQELELGLRRSMQGESITGIVQALHELAAQPDRLTSTPGVIAEAENTMRDREARLRAQQNELDKLLPHAVDLALVIARTLLELEPNERNRQLFDELTQRLSNLEQLHEKIDDAINSQDFNSLESLIEHFTAFHDRLSTSEDSLQAAQRILDEHYARLERLSADVDNLRKKDLEKAIRIIRERISPEKPGHPLIAELPKLEHQRQELGNLQSDLENYIARENKDSIRKTVDTLRRREFRLKGTNALIEQGEEKIVAINRAASWRRKRNTILSLAIGIPLATGLVLVVREEIAYRNIENLQQANELDACDEAIASFQQDPLFFLHHSKVATLKDNVARQRLNDEVQTILALEGDDAKAQQLVAFKTKHENNPLAASLIVNVNAELAILADTADSARYEAAKAEADIVLRRQLLTNYIATSEHQKRKEFAQDLIDGIDLQLDDAAWEKVDSLRNDLPAYLAALEAYVNGPTTRRRLTQAEQAIKQTRIQIAEQAALREDQDAWAAVTSLSDNPRAQMAAAMGYLADRPNGKFASQAQDLLERIPRHIDDDAWATAIASDGRSKNEQIALLQAYLQADTIQGHANEAQARINALYEDIDSAAWITVRDSEGTPQQRIALAKDYLAGETLKRHSNEAEQLIAVELAREDFNAWIAAQSVADYSARIHAIEKYLAGTTLLEYQKNAEAEIREVLDILNRSDDDVLRKADPDILARLNASTLRRVSPETLQRLEALPLQRLEALDPTVLVRFPPELAAKLSLPVRGRLERRPSWANSHGVDDYSPWATFSVAGLTLTLRPVILQNPDQSEKWLWVSETEITQAQWQSVLTRRRDQPSEFKASENPVDSVSWDLAQKFLTTLYKDDYFSTENPTKPRLLTQDEMLFILSTAGGGWQRADVNELAIPSADKLPTIATVTSNSGNDPDAVGSRQRDGWGLADIYGNIAEWVTHDGENPIVMGGSFATDPSRLNPEWQALLAQDTRDNKVGLRLVIDE